MATSRCAAAQAGPALLAADKAALGQFCKNLEDHKFSEMPTYTTPARADGDGGQSVFNTLLVKRGGKWLILLAQSTPVDARAAAAKPIR